MFYRAMGVSDILFSNNAVFHILFEICTIFLARGQIKSAVS